MCKGLRKIGVDAHMIIQRPSHVASLPQWEDGIVDMGRLGDPYDPNWDAFTWDMPHWVHVWNAGTRKIPFSRTLRWTSLFPKLLDYDLVIGHAPFAKVSTLYQRITRKPYALLDAGWIRYLPEDKSGYRRAREGYRKAALLFFTNVDTEPMFKKQGYSNLAYTPFAIDTDKYSPTRFEPDHPMFFHPARHDWPEKGNDKLIVAFAKYVHDRNSRAELRMVEWYQAPEDLALSKRLVSDLDVAGNVTWLHVMPKNMLLQEYRASTAVFDQFVFGALGTTGPETLSVGKPCVAYVKPELWLPHHASPPPVVNAQTTDEIYQAMVQLEDADFRKTQGTLGREWILKNCEDRLVARMQLKYYEAICS